MTGDCHLDDTTVSFILFVARRVAEFFDSCSVGKSVWRPGLGHGIRLEEILGHTHSLGDKPAQHYTFRRWWTPAHVR
jgi:hypothetical protein